MTRSKLFQNAARHFLQLAKPVQVLLKIVVQDLRVLRPELRPQNHVAQLHRVREQRILMQFFQGETGIVVIHGFPQQLTSTNLLYPREVAEEKFSNGGTVWNGWLRLPWPLQA